jgi:hypothetical protein
MMTWDSVSSTKCLLFGTPKSDDMEEQTSAWYDQFGRHLRRLVPQMCMVQAVLTQLRLSHT